MNPPKKDNLQTGENPNIKLTNDIELLDLMLTDEKNQPPLYRSGSRWAIDAKETVKEIKRIGITDFRGSSRVGLGYADSLLTDIQVLCNHGVKRLAKWLLKLFPLSKIFEAQLRWTEEFAKQNIVQVQELISMKERNRNLLKKYTVPFSLLGNCLRKANIDGHDYAVHYLDLLEQHDNIASRINFKKANTIFEIGGGFGTNIHLLLENYKNIRKVLYLDIPPMLYVGTQYLKAFYGSAVFDYRDLKGTGLIKFSSDDNLQIYCIAPWQIEQFEGAVDMFMNSHSFVEIPKNIVQNYINKFNGFPESINAAVQLTSYDGFEQKLDTTFHPNELPKFFNNRKFEYFEVDTLLSSSRKNLFFSSPGKLSHDAH